MAEREYKIPSSEREHFANPPILVKKTKIRVHVPEELEDTKGAHVWDPRRTPNGELMGYQPVSYDRADNDYPKMLFHPDYGKKPQPDQSKFVRSGMSPADYEAAILLYQTKVNEWNKGNRTKLAKDEDEEKRLLAKGWLPTPPQHASKKKEFDLDSDEI